MNENLSPIAKEDYSRLTLGECLSAYDYVVRRNAVSILKRLQKQKDQWCQVKGCENVASASSGLCNLHRQ